MSINFDVGEYLKRDSASVTAAPLSISLLLNRDATNLNVASLMVDGATDNGWAVGISGSQTVFLEVAVAGAFDYAITAGTLAAGTWGQVGGMVTSATLRHAILNGVKSTANTSRPPALVIAVAS